MEDWEQRQIDTAAGMNFVSKECEESLLGCLIGDFRFCRDCFDELAQDDFAVEINKKIFKTIKYCADAKIEVDLVTLGDNVQKIEGDMARSGEIVSAMIDAMKKMPTRAHVRSYLRIVKELSARRTAIRKVAEITAMLNDTTQDVAAIADRMRIDSANIISGNHNWVSMADVAMSTYGYISRRFNGEITSITTGVKNVDAIIGGFFGGELTVVGARPAVGKSAFGMNIAMKAAEQGYKVGICSREMTDVQYGQRVMSYVTKMDGGKIRRAEFDPDDWVTLANGLSGAAAMQIEFLFTVRSVEELRTEVHRKVSRGELDMLIVDYLQLMTTAQRFEADRLRVGYISRALKDIALDFNIPVIALAQVKRYAGGARAKMPTLEDLKDSGSIEQDADGVIFLHVPYDSDDDYVDPRDKDYFDIYKKEGYTYLCIGVAKQRQGPTGKACVLFDRRTMHYIGIDRG